MTGDGKWRTMNYRDGQFIVWRMVDGHTQYQLTEHGNLIEFDYTAARDKARELNAANVTERNVIGEKESDMESLDDYEADPQEIADDLARIESWRRKALAEYFESARTELT